MIEMTMEVLDSSNYETYSRKLKENLKREFDLLASVNNISEDKFERYFSFIDGFIKVVRGKADNSKYIDPKYKNYFDAMKSYAGATIFDDSASGIPILSSDDIRHIGYMCNNLAVCYMQSDYPKSVPILQPLYITESFMFFLIYSVILDFSDIYDEFSETYSTFIDFYNKRKAMIIDNINKKG